MIRTVFALILALGVLAAPLSGAAQQADKIARIGYLALNLAAGDPRVREAFHQGLRDLGYVEGRNLLIEYRDAEGKTERFPALAAELVALKVDVIVTAGGTLGALAAKQATRTLPVVFTAVGDPVTEGLVSSLARPGGNVTGLSPVSQELVGKSLELLKQAVPGVSRVAFLLKPDAMPDRAKKDRLKAADVAARALGVRLQVVEARGPEDFDRAFSDMTRARAGALAVLATPVFDIERRRLVDLAAKNRLPTMYSYRVYVEAGGLMSYGPDLADLFRSAATYVDISKCVGRVNCSRVYRMMMSSVAPRRGGPPILGSPRHPWGDIQLSLDRQSWLSEPTRDASSSSGRAPHISSESVDPMMPIPLPRRISEGGCPIKISVRRPYRRPSSPPHGTAT